jgi:hypothetical protein
LDARAPRYRRGRADATAEEEHVEFLNFVLMFVIALLLASRRDHERLAFRLLVASVLLMVALFSIATRTALLPGVNY